MEAEGKAQLKSYLADQLRSARHDLLKVSMDVSLWTAAVELWSQLEETAELGTVTAAQFASRREQHGLEELIARLERGLAALDSI